jgi:hypothetical protein
MQEKLLYFINFPSLNTAQATVMTVRDFAVYLKFRLIYRRMATKKTVYYV